MAILCGVDFSEYALRASRVAAHFARALGERLVLVHVVDFGALGWAAESVAEDCARAAEERLGQVADQLAADDLEIEIRAPVGTPEEKLAEAAEETGAQLLVIGVLGHRSAQRWRVGTLAGQLLRTAPAPVLLVADEGPFAACARGERPLRVLVGAGFAASSDAAVGWLATLRRLGACDATVLHVYDPARERTRLGLHGPVSAEGDPDVESVLLRDLQARIGDLPGPGHTQIRVLPSLDWVAESLARVVEQERFDLVLAGSRRRDGLARIRHDSVSAGLLGLAPTSVLCVPVAAGELRTDALPRLERVLAPTDLSAHGNAGVRYAYALLPAGGTVYLLHAVEEAPLPNPLYAHYEPGRRPTPEQRAAQSRDLERALRALIPWEAEARGIQTRIEIVHDAEPEEAILAAAERLGADAICMSSHGHSGLSRLLGGSVAQKVAADSRRPVFLVRSPSEE